jgi:hypothetical protein
VSLDDELNRLYGLPLGEFTEARNDLAGKLRRAGEREAADEVKALAKPSLPAWAVNQLARRERMQMRSLLTAGERLREAQAQVLGGGSAEALQDALQRHREVVRALGASATEILEAAGHPATDATLERLRGTLTATAGDAEAARLVEQGRLTADLDPAGLGTAALGAGAVRPPPAKKSPAGSRRGQEARRRRIEEAKRKVDDLRAEVAERKVRARKAQTDAVKAERAAEAARQVAAKAAQQVEALADELEAARDALERARSA